nr:unnamed protein product [Callosobruchus chinensis]
MRLVTSHSSIDIQTESAPSREPL